MKRGAALREYPKVEMLKSEAYCSGRRASTRNVRARPGAEGPKRINAVMKLASMWHACRLVEIWARGQDKAFRVTAKSRKC